MHFVDVHNPERVKRKPDRTVTLLTSGSFEERGFLISCVELRLYEEKTDKGFGPYSLITSFVETDKGSVEMVYDEGFRGRDALTRTVQFIASNMGLSALVLRSIIALKDHIENQDT